MAIRSQLLSARPLGPCDSPILCSLATWPIPSTSPTTPNPVRGQATELTFRKLREYQCGPSLWPLWPRWTRPMWWTDHSVSFLTLGNRGPKVISFAFGFISSS